VSQRLVAPLHLVRSHPTSLLIFVHMRITNRTNSRSFNCVFTPSSYFAGTGWRRLECTRRSTPPRRSRRRTPTCGSSSRPRRTCAWHEYTPTRIGSHTHRVSAPSRTRERAETTNVKKPNLRYRARSHAHRVDVPAHPRPRTREAWHGTRVVRAFSQLGGRSRRRRRTWRAFECDARATVTLRQCSARVEAVPTRGAMSTASSRFVAQAVPFVALVAFGSFGLSALVRGRLEVRDALQEVDDLRAPVRTQRSRRAKAKFDVDVERARLTEKNEEYEMKPVWRPPE